MAVQSNVTKSALTIKYKEGVGDDGKDVIKAKKFSNVKTSAVNDDIYAIGTALAPLLKYPLLDTIRTDESILIDL